MITVLLTAGMLGLAVYLYFAAMTNLEFSMAMSDVAMGVSRKHEDMESLRKAFVVNIWGYLLLSTLLFLHNLGGVLGLFPTSVAILFAGASALFSLMRITSLYIGASQIIFGVRGKH